MFFTKAAPKQGGFFISVSDTNYTNPALDQMSAFVTVKERNIPVQERKFPAQERNVPVQERSIPAQKRNIPVQERNVPIQERNIPSNVKHFTKHNFNN